MEVTDNEFSRQYQVKIEGELAYIERYFLLKLNFPKL